MLVVCFLFIQQLFSVNCWDTPPSSVSDKENWHTISYSVIDSDVLLEWDPPEEAGPSTRYKIIIFRRKILAAFETPDSSPNYVIPYTGCHGFGVIVTAIGLEQSRSSFNAYVIIDFDNLAPGVPSNLTVSIDENTSGHIVKWMPPIENATGCSVIYILEMKLATATKWIQVYTGIASVYHAKYLYPNTYYNYRVAAMTASMDATGQFSEVVTKKSGSVNTTQLKGFTIRSTNDTIKLRWINNPIDDIDAFYLVTLISNEGSREYIIPAVEQTWYNLSHLHPCSTYTVSIVRGDMASILHPMQTSIQTSPRNVPQVPVIRSTNTSCGAISIQLHPGSQGEDVNSFLVGLVHEKNVSRHIVKNDNSRIELTGLECDEEYNITVQASNACGHSDKAFILGLRAMDPIPPSRPENLSIQVTQSSLFVNWSHEKVKGLFYSISIEQVDPDSGRKRQMTVANTDNRFFLLERLRPCTEFIVSVIARNIYGNSSSMSSAVRTLAPVPDIIPMIEAEHIDATTHKILWTHDHLCMDRCNVSYQLFAESVNHSWRKIWLTQQQWFIFRDLNYTRTYRYKVRILVGLPYSFGNFSEEVLVFNPPYHADTFLSPWSYVILLIAIGFYLGLISFLSIYEMSTNLCPPQKS